MAGITQLSGLEMIGKLLLEFTLDQNKPGTVQFMTELDREPYRVYATTMRNSLPFIEKTKGSREHDIFFAGVFLGLAMRELMLRDAVGFSKAIIGFCEQQHRERGENVVDFFSRKMGS